MKKALFILKSPTSRRLLWVTNTILAVKNIKQKNYCKEVYSFVWFCSLISLKKQSCRECYTSHYRFIFTKSCVTKIFKSSCRNRRVYRNVLLALISSLYTTCLLMLLQWSLTLCFSAFKSTRFHRSWNKFKPF